MPDPDQVSETPSPTTAERAIWKRLCLLVRACVASSNGVGFDEVKAGIYPPEVDGPTDKSREGMFRRDDAKSVAEFEKFTTGFLAPFGLPAPSLRFADGRLVVANGRRPYLHDLREAAPVMDTRRRLARCAAGAGWPATTADPDIVPLVPAGHAHIFVGFGTTMTLFVQGLRATPVVPDRRLTIHTTNVEAMVAVYCHSPADKKANWIDLRLGHLPVDRTVAAVTLRPEKTLLLPRTAFISCDGLSPAGLYSTAPKHLHELTAKFLGGAERVVIIAERGKIGRDGGTTIRVPGLDKKRVLLVSDAPVGEVRGKLPSWVEYQQA